MCYNIQDVYDNTQDFTTPTDINFEHKLTVKNNEITTNNAGGLDIEHQDKLKQAIKL